MIAHTSYAKSQVEALAKGFAFGLTDVFGVKCTLRGEARELPRLQTDKGFIVRIPFYGVVAGEYSIALDEEVAVKVVEAAGMTMAGDEASRRLELVDIFGEALNVSVGPAVAQMEENYSHITFATPRAGFGSVYYPGIPDACLVIETLHGDVECHFHIDRMRIASSAPINEFEALNHELQRSLNQTEAILSGLEQGVLVVSMTGKVSAVCSGVALEIFGVRSFADWSISDLLSLNEADEAQLLKWFELIKNPQFYRQWSMCVKLNPVHDIEYQREIGLRTLRIKWRPIVIGDQLERVLVIVTDMTDDLRSQEEIARLEQSNQRVTERMVALIGSDPRELGDFLGCVQAALRAARNVGQVSELADDGKALYIEFHTIKGTAGTFGFDGLTSTASAIEDEFAHAQGLRVAFKHPGLGTSERLTEVLDAMAAELAQIEELFATVYTEGADRLSVDRRGYEALVEDLGGGAITNLDHVRVRVESLDSLEFAVFCRRFDRVLQQFRGSSGKKIGDLEVVGGDILVHTSVLRIMDPCLVHVVRNAIDHGFEFDRDVLGKGPGRLTIACTPVPSGIEISVEDDGGGIRADLIAQRAVRLGLVTKSEVDTWDDSKKLELIYATGFSSAATITDISGRGAGMGAVREILRERGGSIEVSSAAGVGTQVKLFIPSFECAGWSVAPQRDSR